LAKLRAGEVVTCTKLNEFEHPDIAEASRRVVEAARRHGKFAGTVAGVDGFQRRVDEGYRFVSVSADVVLLAEGFARVAAALGGAPSSPVENADIYTGRIP
jgi:2-keto-3-deoxy-L-rhamnonate aldolase RhmA